MSTVFNLIPGMPADWKEGDPAPWRQALGYAWQKLVSPGQWQDFDLKSSTPGKDIRYTGPETLEAVLALLRKDHGAITVTGLSPVTNTPGYTEKGMLANRTEMQNVATINCMWPGADHFTVYVGNPQFLAPVSQEVLDRTFNIRLAKEILTCPKVFEDEASMQAWRRRYKNVVNEGEDGNIPLTVTKADQDWARQMLQGYAESATEEVKDDEDSSPSPS